MALPNPIYIGENALHTPSSIRLLSYGLTAGIPGVLGNADCAIKALGTPSGAIQAMPGAYMVRAKHLGGSYEGYAGKYDVAEQRTVSPTTSSGGRSDLVVLVIQDPYVSGAGSWSEPADLVNGPYADILVIEGVSSTTWDIAQCAAPYNTYSAITLAKITRPASTGIVQQSHITDLRSLAQLGGSRTVVIENPPVTVPPIAQQVYAASTKCTANDTLLDNQTAWKDFPAQASWPVPVPDWARTVSVMLTETPSSQWHVWAEVRMMIDGTPLSPREVDVNRAADDVVNVYRATIPYGGVYTVPDSARGRVVTVKMQAHSAYSGTGKVIMKADGPEADGKAGCYVDMWLLFQRNPS